MLNAIKDLITATPAYILNRTGQFIDRDFSYNMYIKAKDSVFKLGKDTFFCFVNIVNRPKIAQTGQTELSRPLQSSPTLIYSNAHTTFGIGIGLALLCFAIWWLCQPDDDEQNEETV